MPPYVTISYLREWLLTYADLKMKCPDEFRRRLEQAESESPPKIASPLELDLPPREKRCLHQPPEAEVAGLLWDVLLCLYERGESLTEICEMPHMRLLEITPQEVAAENELRKEEKQKGNQCRYCQEYILTHDEVCRFCEGSENKVPIHFDRYFDKQIDPQLLRQVILYESAWRRLNDGDPVPQAILDINSCSQKEIEQEILRQETGQHEQPMPSFTKRMVEVGLVTSWTPEQLCVMALSDLAKALDTKKAERADEALIVLDHALRSTEGKDELMNERGDILSDLALLYLRQKDDAKYKLYDKMSNECKSFGLSDEMKALMDKSNESIANMFKDGNIHEMSPEMRLASLDTDFAIGSEGMMSDLVEKLGDSVPGLGEMFASLQSGMEDLMKTTRLILEAQVAQKNGDFELAESKYTEALACTKEDSVTGLSTKISVLCSLSEVKRSKGDDAAAEALLKDAVKCATEFAEAQPTLGKTSLWPALVTFACFLRDVGNYEESEQNFQQALLLQNECATTFIEKYGGEHTDYSGEKADIKEKYALLLRVLKRDEEAEKLEAEVIALKQEAEDRAAELKARRERLNPGQ